MAETPSENRRAAEPERLDVSPYDRASSLMISLLVTVGLATVVLVAGWLSVEVYQSRKPSGPITLVDPIGDGDGRKVGGSLLDEPAAGPSAGRDARSVDPVRDAAEIRDAAANAWAAEIEDLSVQRSERQRSDGPGDPTHPGGGPKGGTGGRPRNWEVVFGKGLTLDQYARRLDFFKIELGVVRPGGKIDYAFHLSKPKPDTRTITEAYKNERRYWLRWTDGELKKADDELLERAGIDPEGWLLKFVPRDTEVLLANLEQAKAGPDRERAVKRTRFGVREVGNGFEFFVVEQTYKE
jgi:hypothetical protein